MPKIYRGMKQEQGKPAIGPTAQTLGVCVPSDIAPDTAGMVHPGIGGMSVAPSLADLPVHRVPEGLRHLRSDARADDTLCVWSMGTGGFVEEPLNNQLRLRQDPNKDTHGFVEPISSMSLDEYQNAVAATQDQWVIDER